jgi:hypothetical protein
MHIFVFMNRLASALIVFGMIASCVQQEKPLPNAIAIDSVFYGDALLLTNFKSLNELQQVVSISFYQGNTASVLGAQGNTEVHLLHRGPDGEVNSQLAKGISQSDFVDARKGTIWHRLSLVLKSPYALQQKSNLQAIEYLGRRRPLVFGMGDVAFYDLAETMVHHISPMDTLRMTPAELSEKGYLNTFNHITAQAFMTSIFSERLADFVADVHERYNMPELIAGNFTAVQLADIETGPVDNYVDIINNEWGQELGKWLQQKYQITRHTRWTSATMAAYLNDIQQYHSLVFGIGFAPFRTDEEVVVRFADKINRVLDDRI